MISIAKYDKVFEQKYLKAIKNKIKIRTKFDLEKLTNFENLNELVQEEYESVNKSFIKELSLFLLKIYNNLDIFLVGNLSDASVLYYNLLNSSEKFVNMLSNKDNNLVFTNLMKDIFDYDYFIVRNKELSYDISNNCNISVCPYCNESMIYTIKDEENNYYRPEFDHFLAKSKFPVFAINLYNLVPSCHICNYIKKDYEFSIEKNLNPFLDGVENEKIFNYKQEDIDKYVVDITSNNINFMNNCKILLLNQRYEHLHNEKIIQMKKLADTYTNDVLNKMRNLDSDLKISRLLDILGYDDDIMKIRNRLLGKFENDIAIQIIHDLEK